MSYSVFARKYRPQTFEEVVGQEHVATTLRNAIGDERVGHAYLFSGPRGVGKTSMARIFAKSLNCVKGPTPEPCLKCDSCSRIAEGSDTDVIEMDAASNRSVEDARALREGVQYSPLRSRSKIYIIDEAHMLTKEAFNTLLKTLEEPPPHVKFFFATTETEKLPDTIRSRCQRFDFRRITTGDVVRRLQQICKKESIKIHEDALASIARTTGGAMRDAQSMLDQIAAYASGEITLDDVHQMTGAISPESSATMVSAIRTGDIAKILEEMDRIFAAGVEPDMMHRQLLERFRSLLILKACGPSTPLLDLNAEERAAFGRESESFSLGTLLNFMQSMFDAVRRMKEGSHPRVVLETTLIRLAAGTAAKKDGPAGQTPIERVPPPTNLPVEHPKAPAKAADPSTGVKKKQDPLPALRTPPPEAVLPGAPPAPLRKSDIVSSTAPGKTLPSLDYVHQRWPEILEKLSKTRMTIATYLRNGRITTLKGRDLVISYEKQHTFQKDLLENQANRNEIESVLEDVFGTRLGFRCILEHGPAPAAPAPLPQAAPRPVQPPATTAAPRPTTDVVSEPGLRRVMEIFEGKIVSLED